MLKLWAVIQFGYGLSSDFSEMILCNSGHNTVTLGAKRERLTTEK
jgi:hypothetical protein|tara:strand:- start:378 stop:512 length:135 start_codon:yes stop_codon:yes gene_type:complete